MIPATTIDLAMRKHLLRILLIYIAFEVFREVGSNIPMFIRNQPVFELWRSRNGILLSISTFINFLLYPLTSFVIFYKVYSRQKKLALLYWFISISAIIFFRYSIEEWIFPQFFHFRNYADATPLFYYYSDNIFFACLFSAFGVVYYFILNERMQQLRETQLQLTNKQTELSFLRSQINPHFLFNSLNNIYSLVYHKSDQSLNAIAKLSDLLRYMLYDTNEKVPLQKELDYINRYMELQQMRLENAPLVHLNIAGNIDKTSVPPLLLIPFVENAFKHGDMKNAQAMSINVFADDTALRFYMSNAVGQHQKDAVGGIGLENVQRRLELLYPNRHSLHIQQTNDIFEVQLEIRK